MVLTVGELIEKLQEFKQDTAVKIEFYEENKDFSWYAKVFDVYEINNKEMNHNEVIIEAN